MRYLLPAILALFSIAAGAEIKVASKTVAIVEKTIEVPAGGVHVQTIGRATVGDTFEFYLQKPPQGLTIGVLDRANLELAPRDEPFRRLGESSGKFVKVRVESPESRDYFFHFDNRKSASAVKATFHARNTLIVPDENIRPIRSLLEAQYAGLKAMLNFPDFSVIVRPCNLHNAFSTPHIYLCSELILEMFENGQAGAIQPVFFHEMCHSLLNVWRDPTHGNEDQADECGAALTLLTRGGRKNLEDVVRWFESQDLRKEAEMRRFFPTGHSTIPQRVRNIRRIMADPAPTVNKWVQAFIPFMTSGALAEIAASGSDRTAELARQELKRRG